MTEPTPAEINFFSFKFRGFLIIITVDKVTKNDKISVFGSMKEF